MKVRGKLFGMGKLQKKLNAPVRRLPWSVGGATKEAVEVAYRISQNLVPVDTGALRRSGFRRVYLAFKGYAGELRYGDGLDYAVYVHERLDLTHTAPTGAKFVELAMDEVSRAYGPEIARRIKASFGG